LDSLPLPLRERVGVRGFYVQQNQSKMFFNWLFFEFSSRLKTNAAGFLRDFKKFTSKKLIENIAEF
jgi:hypothetical protein